MDGRFSAGSRRRSPGPRRSWSGRRVRSSLPLSVRAWRSGGRTTALHRRPSRRRAQWARSRLCPRRRCGSIGARRRARNLDRTRSSARPAGSVQSCNAPFSEGNAPPRWPHGGTADRLPAVRTPRRAGAGVDEGPPAVRTTDTRWAQAASGQRWMTRWRRSGPGAKTRVRHETISTVQPMRFRTAVSVSTGPLIATRSPPCPLRSARR